MTVYDNTLYTAKPQNPAFSVGKKMVVVPTNPFIDVSEVANGDIWVLAGPLSLDARVHKILVNKSFDLTAAADNDFGFYKKNNNGTYTAIDKDILVDGLDLTAGSGLVAGHDILVANTSLDRSKNIGQLLGVKSDVGYSEVYLCMTMNTKETTADVTLMLEVVIDEATTN